MRNSPTISAAFQYLLIGDFAKLDAIVLPVLSVGDHSLEFQIAVAPPFPGLVDSSGHLIVNAANLQLMASYFANLARYYNKGGLTWGGQTFKSLSSFVAHHLVGDL